jgi:hypothetical protein
MRNKIADKNGNLAGVEREFKEVTDKELPSMTCKSESFHRVEA